MLLTILPGAVYANGWLTVKLTLLGVYVVLARLHHPLGPLWALVR